jgi:hypothetical protein
MQDGSVKDFDANYSLLSPFICQAVGTKEEKRIDKTKSQLAAEKQLSKESSSSSSSAAGSSSGSGSGSKMEVTPGGGGGSSSSDTPALAHCFAVTKHDNQVKSVTLQGHQGEVFICLWNPVTQQLASG